MILISNLNGPISVFQEEFQIIFCLFGVLHCKEQHIEESQAKIIVYKYYSDKMEAENNESGGYDFQTKFITLYECPICKKIIRRFTELPCHHFSCRKCLEHWERQQRTNHKQREMYESLDEQ